MKTRILAALVTTGLAGVAQASIHVEGTADGAMQPVDSIRVFQRLDGWRPLDRDTLIIWATPSQPYLVELSRKSHDLRFANSLGVTSTAGTVYAKFDSVVVDGFRYPIRAIYRIDRDTARHLKAAG